MNPADAPGADEEQSLLAVGRFGHIEEIAAMAAHLAGAGGGSITGASIAVDGGFAAEAVPPLFGGGSMHGEQSWRGAFSSAPVSSRSYGPPP